MTAADFIPKRSRSASGNSSINSLELIDKNILLLRAKLSSYICEPKTFNLYKKLENLKKHLEEMHKNNLELINTFRSKSLLPEDGKAMVQQQFEAYKKLELKVLEYIGMAKMHC